MAGITNVTPECTSITELRICLKPLIRKMYQSYGIMYPDYISVSFLHCATTDYSYLSSKTYLASFRQNRLKREHNSHVSEHIGVIMHPMSVLPRV